MKLDSILIILIVNAIFWSLINSVKNNEDKKELTRAEESSKDNDRAESSVNAQLRMLKPKAKITKKGTTKDKKEEKRLNKSEYMRIYRQNNREKGRNYERKYRENNREKKRERDRKYRENNREKVKESARKYRLNNKEKKKESDRKYREKNKNKKVNLKNVDPKVGNIHFDNEGTSFVRNDIRNKGKLPIVYKESIFNQEKEEAETHMEEQNQTVVEEPTKVNSINQIDLNEEYYLLTEKFEDEDEDVFKKEINLKKLKLKKVN